MKAKSLIVMGIYLMAVAGVSFAKNHESMEGKRMGGDMHGMHKDGYCKSCMRKSDHGESLEHLIHLKMHFIIKNQKEANITDDQIENIMNLGFAVKKELIKRNAEIKIIGIDIMHGLKQDEINVESLKKLVDKKYELKKAKNKYLVQKYAQLKGLLKKTQWDKLKEIWKEKWMK